MKFKYLFFIFLIGVVGIQAANNKRLLGVWELTEFKLIQKGKTSVSDEKTLRDAGAVWDLEFAGDSIFRQNFNMRSPDGKMETETGKWYTINDSLFIELKKDTNISRINYSYILLGDVVVLTLENQVTTDKMITRFRRK